jgi:hypothetical protein
LKSNDLTPTLCEHHCFLLFPEHSRRPIVLRPSPHRSCYLFRAAVFGECENCELKGIVAWDLTSWRCDVGCMKLGGKRKTNGFCVGITTLCFPLSAAVCQSVANVFYAPTGTYSCRFHRWAYLLLPQFPRVLFSGFSMIRLGRLGPLSVPAVLKITSPPPFLHPRWYLECKSGSSFNFHTARWVIYTTSDPSDSFRALTEVRAVRKFLSLLFPTRLPFPTPIHLYWNTRRYKSPTCHSEPCIPNPTLKHKYCISGLFALLVHVLALRVSSSSSRIVERIISKFSP